MRLANVLCVLIALVFATCNQPNDKSTSTQTTVQQPIKQQFTSGFAPVNGLNMYYEVYGTGAPLVLIHGGGSTIQTTFGRVLHEFAKTRKVIAVEIQAHGRTADINRPLSFESDADDVAALLKHLNINKADVFGFSNGEPVIGQ